MSELEQYFRTPRRSRGREYLLTTRLIHDFTVAAASRGYDLLVYLPTVDADGFDVIFDDQDRIVPVQLKSMVWTGKAASWTIHRSLLRPEPEEAELFGFEPSPSGTGRGGAVILTKVKGVDNSVEVSYSYTDVSILSLYWCGVLPLPKPQRERLDRLKKEMEEDTRGKVKVPRSAFVEAHSPAHLLALAGLQSNVETSWRFRLMQFLRKRKRPDFGERSEEALRIDLQEDVSSLFK